MLGCDSDRSCSGSWGWPEPENLLYWWDYQANANTNFNNTPNYKQPSDGQGPLQTLQQHQWWLDQFSSAWLHHTSPLRPAPGAQPRHRCLYWQCGHSSDSGQGQHAPMATYSRDICINYSHSGAQGPKWYHLYWPEELLWVHSTGVCSHGGHRGTKSHQHRWVLHPHSTVPGLAERLSRRILQDDLRWGWSNQVSAVSFSSLLREM